ncbi:hypothetical protein D9M73_186910 [compost metagenome]
MRFTALGVGENQVDVRRQVQFHRAELAHAEDDHLLRFAAAPADGRAELLAMALVQPLIRLVDGGIGHVRKVTAGLGQVGLASQVAPDDAHLMACSLPPQLAAQLVVTLGALGGCSNLCAQLPWPEAAIQFTTGDQAKEHRRIAHDLLQNVLAGRANPCKVDPALGWPVAQIKRGDSGHGGPE